MRTTLSIDVDVLMAARDLAKRQKTTIGDVISGLARKALTQPLAAPAETTESFFGITPLPHRGGPLITNEMVNAIREEEGI